MFKVPAEVIHKTTKCGHNFSCLETGSCGDSPMCGVQTRLGDGVVCVSVSDWRDCAYHLDFGGAKFCVCPVRCAIHRQQGL